MDIKTIPIDDLKPYAHNPKTHPAEQVEKIARSIEEFSFLVPVLIDADNSIIAGHGRLLAARKLGLDEIPTICVDHLTEAQIRAYRIADNRLTESSWDLELLESEISILQDMDFDIDLTGFDDIEIGELFPTDPEPEDFDAEAAMDGVSVPLVQAGELWILGDHRVMCGDSTKREDVERLMNGEKADMVVTSPPYFNQRQEYSVFENYEMYNEFLLTVVDNILKISNNPFILAWNTGDNQPDCLPMIADQTNLIHATGLTYLDTIIWKKAGAIYSIPRSAHIRTNNYFYPALCWEPIIVFRKGDKMPKFETSDVDEISEFGTNHWEINQVVGSQQEKIGHPAMYPVELPRRVIMSYSSTKAIVYEPFGGSGTTLIACEQLNRRCYMMELDPHYCGVILDRWANYTKEDPIREDGMLWSELKESQ